MTADGTKNNNCHLYCHRHLSVCKTNLYYVGMDNAYRCPLSTDRTRITTAEIEQINKRKYGQLWWFGRLLSFYSPYDSHNLNLASRKWMKLLFAVVVDLSGIRFETHEIVVASHDRKSTKSNHDSKHKFIRSSLRNFCDDAWTKWTVNFNFVVFDDKMTLARKRHRPSLACSFSSFTLSLRRYCSARAHDRRPDSISNR